MSRARDVLAGGLITGGAIFGGLGVANIFHEDTTPAVSDSKIELPDGLEVSPGGLELIGGLGSIAVGIYLLRSNRPEAD